MPIRICKKVNKFGLFCFGERAQVRKLDVGSIRNCRPMSQCVGRRPPRLPALFTASLFHHFSTAAAAAAAPPPAAAAGIVKKWQELLIVISGKGSSRC